jgi:hypothetical protein
MSWTQVRGSVPRECDTDLHRSGLRPLMLNLSSGAVFWEQQGMQAFGQKLQITRPPQVSQLAFEKHFDELVDVYQRVHNLKCVRLPFHRLAAVTLTEASRFRSLLGTKDQEVVLSTSYNDHLKAYSRSKPPPPLVAITNFDFHGAVRVGGAESVRTGIRALPAVRDAVEGFGWTLVDAASSGKAHVIEEQRGVFRTNCLDWCGSPPSWNRRLIY